MRATGERFPLEARRAADVSVFHPRPSDPRVTLLVEPGDRWVVDSYPTESVTEEPDGRLRVVLAVGGRAWLERLLLRLGPSGEVVAPDDLRDTGAQAARRLLARYRTPAA